MMFQLKLNLVMKCEEGMIINCVDVNWYLNEIKNELGQIEKCLPISFLMIFIDGYNIVFW
jgi:hypothetical protein